MVEIHTNEGTASAVSDDLASALAELLIATGADEDDDVEPTPHLTLIVGAA